MKNKTIIPEIKAPEGWTQEAYNRALTRHQKSIDKENIKAFRLCGGLEVPYLLTPSQETPPKEIISSENKNSDLAEAELNEAFKNRTEFYTGPKPSKIKLGTLGCRVYVRNRLELHG